MLSQQLFRLPITEQEITNPYHFFDVAELKHSLKQVNIFLTSQQELGCLFAIRRSRVKKPFFAELAFWLDGNWACFHEEFNRDNPISPGQYQKAYYSSRDESKHFYHLETNTASDLILQC